MRRAYFLLLGVALGSTASAVAQEASTEIGSPETTGDIGGSPAFSPDVFDTGTFFDEDTEPARPGWTVVPELSIKEAYTDNLFLTADNEENDFVTVLTPRINFYGNSRRAEVTVDYALQGLFYAKNGDENTHFHQLFSSGEFELLRQFLFLDGTATITQQNRTDTGRGVFTNFGPATFLGGTGDNINMTGDRTTVTTYRLSPYLVQRFGDWADGELRFEYDEVSESAEDETGDDTQGDDTQGVADSASQRYYARLESGSRFNELPWSLIYNRRDIDYDSGDATTLQDSTTFQQILASLRFIYSPEISLLGNVGYEDNDFASAGDPGSGIIWDIGVRWTPSGRTTLEATYGRRFFGDRYFVNLSHESRRTRWHITYDEIPYTARQAQIDLAAAARGGRIPVIDPETGLPTLTGAGVPTLSNEVYVQRRLSGGVAIEAGRNDFDFLVFQEQRDFQSSTGVRDDLWGASILWTRSLSRLTDLDMSVGWTSEDTEDIGLSGERQERQDDLLGLHVGLRRELGRHLTSAIEYRRVERISDPDLPPEKEELSADFVENRISVTIRLLF